MKRENELPNGGKLAEFVDDWLKTRLEVAKDANGLISFQTKLITVFLEEHKSQIDKINLRQPYGRRVHAIRELGLEFEEKFISEKNSCTEFNKEYRERLDLEGLHQVACARTQAIREYNLANNHSIQNQAELWEKATEITKAALTLSHRQH